MSSSHSLHNLLLLLPLQESSCSNCQYKLINKYKNNSNIGYNICNNKSKTNNKIVADSKTQNILLRCFVVPLLISSIVTPTPTLTKRVTKTNSSTSKKTKSGLNPGNKLLTSSFLNCLANRTTTTTRSIDVQQTKSIKLLLRTLTGSLIQQQIILKNLYILQELLNIALKLYFIKVLSQLLTIAVVKEELNHTSKKSRKRCNFRNFQLTPSSLIRSKGSSVVLILHSEEAFPSRILNSTTTNASRNPYKTFYRKVIVHWLNRNFISINVI
ncbi:hypothetical protein DOY81_000308 [Sarcophaga bullata]|nr:hypothetical protein DOY81_000308 [Sarcophaga bullata]